MAQVGNADGGVIDPDTVDIVMPMYLDDLPAAEVHVVVMECMEKIVQEGLGVSHLQREIHDTAIRQSLEVISEAHEKQFAVMEKVAKRQKCYIEVIWKIHRNAMVVGNFWGVSEDKGAVPVPYFLPVYLKRVALLEDLVLRTKENMILVSKGAADVGAKTWERVQQMYDEAVVFLYSWEDNLKNFSDGEVDIMDDSEEDEVVPPLEKLVVDDEAAEVAAEKLDILEAHTRAEAYSIHVWGMSKSLLIWAILEQLTTVVAAEKEDGAIPTNPMALLLGALLVAAASCLILCLVQACFRSAVEAEVARRMVEARKTIEQEVVEELCHRCAVIQVTSNKSEVYHTTNCKAIREFDISKYRRIRPCAQCTLSTLGAGGNSKDD